MNFKMQTKLRLSGDPGKLAKVLAALERAAAKHGVELAAFDAPDPGPLPDEEPPSGGK